MANLWLFWDVQFSVGSHFGPGWGRHCPVAGFEHGNALDKSPP